MKTRMILAALLLVAFGSLKAQEKPIPTPDGDASKINTLVLNCVGSVYLQQGEKLMLDDYGHSNVLYRVEDSVLYLEGVGSPRVLTIPNLTYLKVSGTVSVRSKGQLKGENLSIFKTGTGVLSLEVGYGNIYVYSTGTGDVILLGDCNVFCSEAKGIGKVNTRNLDYKVLMEKSGDHWNMAMNLDDNANQEWIHTITAKAQPFFEIESNRSWNLSKTNNTWELVDNYLADLNELMREYNDNLQRVYDSIDWKRIDEEIERANQEMQNVYDSLDWENLEEKMRISEQEMREWGRRMEEWGNCMEQKHGKHYEYHYEYNNNSSAPKDDESESSTKKKSPIFNPHWAGFDGGLNMLIDPSVMNVYTGPNESMAIRPLRSWYFGFNLVDFGVAFDKDRKVGMFTGIGLGWNNFSWKNHVRMTVENEQLVNNLLPDDRPVKNSKFGLLYAQAPLMIEVRPTRHMFIDFGVTGGIRLAAWNRIKYSDGSNEKTYSNYLTNLFKCDASFRIGGDNLGFFVNYALIPTFVKGRDADKAHPLMLGFSIVY
jgi:hypothetical protein